MAVSRGKQETEFIEGADDPLDIRAQLEQSTQAIEQLQDALTEERETSASLRDELAAMQAGGSDEGRVRSPKAFIVPLWAVIAVRLALDLGHGLGHGVLNVFLADMAVVACAAILLEHWVKAQWRESVGLFIVKSLFLILGLWGFVAYIALNATGEADIPAIAALLFCSFVMLLVLSPFCAWLMDGLVSFVRHPVATVRGWFR